MKTFNQYLSGVAKSGKMDEGLASMLGFGPKLKSGQPVPQGWGPDVIKAYNDAFAQYGQAGITGQEAHAMATREAEAHMQNASKMAGYQAQARAPQRAMPTPQRAPFGQGTMGTKDMTGHVQAGGPL
jgi:hypothetical protein